MKREGRKHKRPLLLGDGLLVIALTWLPLQHQRRFSAGPEVNFCYTLSRYANRFGLKGTEDNLLKFGRTAYDRRVQGALRSGRLAVIRFNTPDVDPSATAQRALRWANSNSFQVVGVSVSIHPNSFELVIDSKAKPNLELFVGSLISSEANNQAELNLTE